MKALYLYVYRMMETEEVEEKIEKVEEEIEKVRG